MCRLRIGEESSSGRKGDRILAFLVRAEYEDALSESRIPINLSSSQNKCRLRSGKESSSIRKGDQILALWLEPSTKMLYPNLGSFDTHVITAGGGESVGSELGENLHQYGREIVYWPFARGEYRQGALCESYYTNLSLQWTIAMSSHVGRHRRSRNGGWRIGLRICPR